MSVCFTQCRRECLGRWSLTNAYILLKINKFDTDWKYFDGPGLIYNNLDILEKWSKINEREFNQGKSKELWIRKEKKLSNEKYLPVQLYCEKAFESWSEA